MISQSLNCFTESLICSHYFSLKESSGISSIHIKYFAQSLLQFFLLVSSRIPVELGCSLFSSQRSFLLSSASSRLAVDQRLLYFITALHRRQAFFLTFWKFFQILFWSSKTGNRNQACPVPSAHQHLSNPPKSSRESETFDIIPLFPDLVNTFFIFFPIIFTVF